MTSKKATLENTRAEETVFTEVSDRRRKLLKAALTAAPLAATLRSGATSAGTHSAFQCVADNRSQMANADLARDNHNDKWLRITVPEHLFEWQDANGAPVVDTATNEPIQQTRYLLPVPYNDAHQYTFPDNSGALRLMQNDLLGRRPPPIPPGRWTDKGATGNTVFSLIYFDPSADDTEIDATVGIHPTGDGLVGTGAGDPTALDGSCMCSINPNYPGCGTP